MLPALNNASPSGPLMTSGNWHLNALLAGQQLYGTYGLEQENTDCHDLCNTAGRRHGTAGFTESFADTPRNPFRAAPQRRQARHQ